MKTTDNINFHGKMPNTLLSIFLLISVLLTQTNNLLAQEQQEMVRLAKIKVDPAQLSAYNKALLTQMKQLLLKRKAY